MFSPWTWWFVVELSTNVSPNTLQGTNIIYPLYKKKNSSYQPQWEGWVSPYVSLTYSLHRWVPPSLVLTNYCILQKNVCFEGLYPNMGIISDYWVSSGELEESGSSHQSGGWGCCAPPCGVETPSHQQPASRRRGGIGAQTLKEASVNHDAVQPQRGAASHQDKSAWGKTNFTFPWQQNKTE